MQFCSYLCWVILIDISLFISTDWVESCFALFQFSHFQLSRSNRREKIGTYEFVEYFYFLGEWKAIWKFQFERYWRRSKLLRWNLVLNTWPIFMKETASTFEFENIYLTAYLFNCCIPTFCQKKLFEIDILLFKFCKNALPLKYFSMSLNWKEIIQVAGFRLYTMLNLEVEWIYAFLVSPLNEYGYTCLL